MSGPIEALPEIRLLGAGDETVLEHVAADVFDGAIDPLWAAEFLADPRHHLVVAVEDGIVVGMASGVHYLHPDKAPQLFVNEVGVSPAYQGRGIGRLLLDALLAHARTLGCTEAWVLTDHANLAARRLYERGDETAEPQGVLMFTFPLDGPRDVAP